ncbi:hypothetical protein HPP92_021210 [Vanilla planifolia]|uniref:Apyrase n=1 Tax=Vanilla planifolia TaxID=51239 RepID=A0A835UGW6_VANPL|nr:hypothetical protein HPP92_021210 [Vanilla planifolia]
MKRARPESMGDKIHRFRSVIVVVSIPMALVLLVIMLMPRSPAPLPASDAEIIGRKAGPSGGSRSYAVIFDAGSSGSRVHVYCFDGNLDLIPIGQEIELFLQKKPGLSSYAKDPKEAANSLTSLLEKAESVVPAELRAKTPVRVGATAGLRQLGAETSEQILQAVRDLLNERSSLNSKPDWVTVLDGTQEVGRYFCQDSLGDLGQVTINYLLGNLGKKHLNTVGVVDLGAIWRFGLLAARAEILKIAGGSHSDCILNGYHGSYKYSDREFPASASPSGSSYTNCRNDAIKALKHDEPTCTHMKCTFGGVWNGGGGDGQKNLFVASFFFDRAAEAGFVDPTKPFAKVKPADFEEAAKRACKLNVDEAKAIYTNVADDNLPYLCMDLVYQFTLLIDGFGLEPWQDITLVKKVKYHDSLVEAAWPLGSAIEVASLA